MQELRKALQAGDEVEGEDGIIRLDASDIFDIRKGTQRGLQLLDLITQKERASATTQTATSTSTTTTAAAQTNTPVAPAPQRTTATQAPLNVRLTRSAVRALRTANTEDERRRRRIARALAELA